VARDDWRLRIDLGEHGAGGFAARLGLVDSEADELARELRDRRLAVTRDEGVVFVYAPSSLDLEQARAVVERELEGEDATIAVEHWLADEERWDDEAAVEDPDQELLDEGFAPWEVRIPCADHAAAQELGDRLEAEGFGVVRRWAYVIAGCESKEQAQELARRLGGDAEPGGELVYERPAASPFALFSNTVFGGLGGTGTPI
jgi:hypothetical protein